MNTVRGNSQFKAQLQASKEERARLVGVRKEFRLSESWYDLNIDKKTLNEKDNVLWMAKARSHSEK